MAAELCGAWAGALVERLPEAPITDLDALNRWIDGFWEDFAAEFKGRAAADPVKHSKFVREGSNATLVACWMQERDDGMSMHWLGYGDSPLYVFAPSDDGVGLTICHPPTLATLERDPLMLNWKELPIETHLRAGALVLPERATVILASDGVGQFVLLRYLTDLHARCAEGAAVDLRGPARGLLGEYRSLVRRGRSRLAGAAQAHMDHAGADFGRELASLRAHLATDAAFADMVRSHYETELLPNDDATLIMIDVRTLPADGAEDGCFPRDSAAGAVPSREDNLPIPVEQS